MTCNSIDTYKGFSVGDSFIILHKPDSWSSGAQGLYPLDLDYPKFGVIKDIVVCDGHIAMIDTDNYGYTLSDLIIVDNIKIDIKTIRKFKLQEICGKL